MSETAETVEETQRNPRKTSWIQDWLKEWAIYRAEINAYSRTTVIARAMDGQLNFGETKRSTLPRGVEANGNHIRKLEHAMVFEAADKKHVGYVRAVQCFYQFGIHPTIEYIEKPRRTAYRWVTRGEEILRNRIRAQAPYQARYTERFDQQWGGDW